MFYLLAQNSKGDQKILDAAHTHNDVLPMVAHYLKMTKGTLVDDVCDMNSEGVHIIEEKENRTYKIYHTQDAGWVRHSFWSTHVLTYSVVEFLPPVIKISFPPCKDLKDVLKAGKADIDNKTIFF